MKLKIDKQKTKEIGSKTGLMTAGFLLVTTGTGIITSSTNTTDKLIGLGVTGLGVVLIALKYNKFRKQ